MTTSSSPLAGGPLDAYQALLEGGEIRPDAAQERAVGKLQDLHTELVDYAPHAGKKGWMARLGLAAGRTEPPRGLYIYGGVGRGKSMLMDLFFSRAPIEERKHVHFHAFMLEVHERIYNFRQAVKAGEAPESADPLVALARVITDKARLLSFDEFHVSDIADAMILGRLFEALFDAGVVVVTTSNRPPQDLYKGGLQRDRFLPFIELIEQKLDVLELDGGADHRLAAMRLIDTYRVPAGPETDADLEKYFARLILGASPTPKRLTIAGREVHIPRAAEGVAFADFVDLCGQPLGTADYLAVAKRFHTLVLSSIPRLGSNHHNEAKRFVILIDALYEHKVNLICSADTAPEEIYTEGTGAFEFGRTVSRLNEMQSEAYMAAEHIR
ncbi:MAG TPA: cell division protein ZapE [Rhodospirillales bacterium]|nr:cell division protein ZapE [Rhodospirillales bacterium]